MLPLGGAKQRALLAVLLLHADEVVSSDRLIEELWAEAGAGDGREGAVHGDARRGCAARSAATHAS